MQSTDTVRPIGALRRVVSLVVMILVMATAEEGFAQHAVFGPGLQSILQSSEPTQHLAVVVTFRGESPITDDHLLAVRSTGITRGVTFKSLPIMGVLATPDQIRALAQQDGVRSIWPNAELTYFNEDARGLTGVDRLRDDSSLRSAAGLPFSGDGIGVVVNDSGVDGVLPDLTYGENLVENVQGLTNLNAYDEMLPVTYTGGLINTDLGSGHGTHVAGTVGGTGASSNGRFAGVAPGADLIGYGSGAVLLILDAIGGFDYAITHQFDGDHAPIRAITNSWGSSGAFDPNDPVNVASYLAYKRGITVTFAAGNAGPLEDTHNPYAVAPWVISVGAGDKSGRLADFSSRGKREDSGTFTNQDDNTTWTYINQPSIVAPGVSIASARATTGALPVLSAEYDVNELGTLAAFYTHMDGTSMATPHVAGIVALMLEANPLLQPDEVKRILEETATNMPGREPWEVGAGYVNAYAAVVRAVGNRTDYGRTLTATRNFHAAANLRIERRAFSIDYNPQPILSTHNNRMTFEVPPGLALLTARFDAVGLLGQTGNSIYPVLISPDGTEHSSGTSLLFPIEYVRAQVVSSPAVGTWILEIRGLQNGTGQNLVSLPEQVVGDLIFEQVDGFSGLSDIAGSPAEGAIQAAVAERLMDGFPDGTFRPTADLSRGELARYLVLGAGIRQFRPTDGSTMFSDVSGGLAPFAEASAARGAALRDTFQVFDGVVPAENGLFRPSQAVSRIDLAYSLIQSLGLQHHAASFTGDLTVNYNGTRVTVADASDIPADRRGYVQLALDLGLMNAHFTLEQAPFQLEPTVRALFRPTDSVTRGEYAVAAVRYFAGY